MEPIHWIQPFAFLLLAPLLPGIINRVKAFAGGRQGPPVLQAYYDLPKLFRKRMVLSRTVSWVFLAGPVVGWLSVFVASFLVPIGPHGAPLAFDGDMVLLAYLLALGRFFTVSAGWDTASSFEGMGTSREVTFASFSEPVFFLGFMALARWTGSLSLSGMFTLPGAGGPGGSIVPMGLLALAWFIAALCENSRIPFDDPTTHLELTMVHEAMVLDHSGPALGLIEHASCMKLMLLGVLVTDAAFPWAGGTWEAWAVPAAGLVLFALLIGWVESVMARLRLRHVPNLLVSAALLAAFSLIFIPR